MSCKTRKVKREITIVLAIRALGHGGAERQLVMLASELRGREVNVHVVTFYDGGALSHEVTGNGVPLWTAHKKGRRDMLGFAYRIVRILRRLRPDVIYTSMPAANVLFSILSRFAGRPSVVWRLASSDMALKRYDFLSRMSYRVERLLSGMPDLIIANSYAGRRAAVHKGYPADKIRVVVNGIDTCHFRPMIEKGRTLRSCWGLPRDKWVIGQIARPDPKKGYEIFIAAARRLYCQRSDVHFLCVGVDSGDYSENIRSLAHDLELDEGVTWKAPQPDMVSVYNALDINTLSSVYGEGCPNTVLEAMACGVPCVVTNVGDSAAIVGNTGEVIPPGQAELLASAWDRLLRRLEEGREAVHAAARERIQEQYSVGRYVSETEKSLRESR